MTSLHKRIAGTVLVAVSLSGCIGPMGPSPAVAPPPPGAGPGAFSADMRCRQYADSVTAPMRNQANTNAIGSTLVGAGLGAALGAAVGGGRGAGIGAASGAIVGTGVGASNAQGAAMGIQQQYDMAYAQCMSSQAGPPGMGPGAALPPPPPAGAPLPPPPGRY